MHLLILILYNDNPELKYNEMLDIQQSLYQKYYQKYQATSNKKHSIQYHFVEYMEFHSPDTNMLIMTGQHRLIFRGCDTVYPGCIEKTLKSLEYEKVNIESGKYDYIIRTNISTIIDIDNLIKTLENIERPIDYGGVSTFNLYKVNYFVDDEFANKQCVSGTCIIMSPKFVKLIFKHKNFVDINYCDDFLIGLFAYKCIKMGYDINMDLTTLEPYYKINAPEYISGNIFYRNRQQDNNRAKDIINMQNIISSLTKKFGAELGSRT
jgi:hypothetical protein